jgi:hypothetical protein
MNITSKHLIHYPDTRLHTYRIRLHINATGSLNTILHTEYVFFLYLLLILLFYNGVQVDMVSTVK